MKKILLSLILITQSVGIIKSQTGSCLNFDGVNDYCAGAPLANSLNSNLTLEVRANFTGTTSTNQYMAFNGITTGTAACGYGLLVFSGQSSVTVHYGGLGVVSTAIPLNAGTWNTYSLVYGVNTFTMYVNGVSTFTFNSGVDPIAPTTGSFAIGADNSGISNFNGSIDEVRLWNRRLCASEVAARANCQLSGNEPGLVAYYNFNQGTAAGSNSGVTMLPDLSPNGNNATLYNFALTGATSNWINSSGTLNTFCSSTPPIEATITPVTSPTICAGGSVSLTASGINTYTWSTGATTASISVSPTVTTTYTVGGTNSSGCFGYATQTVVVAPVPIISVSSGTICSGSSFTIVPSGASTYTYSSGSAVVTPTSNATYSVTGTSSLGCVSSNTAIVSVTVNNCIPAAALNFDGVNDYVNTTYIENTTDITHELWFKTSQGDQGLFAITDASKSSFDRDLYFTGGNINAYVWQNSTSEIITTSGTNYADGNWHHVAHVVSASVGGQKLYVDGVLKASGAASFSAFNWNTQVLIGYSPAAPANNSFNGNVDEVRIWNVARTQCEINTYKNCEIPTSTAGLVANYHFNQGYDGQSNTSAITLTDVSGNSNSGNLTNFSLSGTTSNWVAPGGVVSGSITPANLSITVGSTVSNSVICDGGSTILNGTGADTYVWTGGIADGVAFFPAHTNTYTVTGTNTVTGCFNTAVAGVTVNALPTVSVTSGAICAGDSYTIVANGASTYTSVPALTGPIVTPTTTTNYSITGTDANGCVSSNTAISSVTVNSLPTISVSSGSICAGDSYTIVANGALTYTSVPALTGPVVTPTATISYTISGTDANGCVSNVDAVSSVTVNPLPSILATTNNTLLCVGQTATLSVSGATTYTWSTTENTASVVVTPTLQTTYTVNGTDVNGCSNITTVTQDVSLCTGIVTFLNSNTLIDVYPNPNNGIFVIELGSTSKVTITNALGEVVISNTFESGKHNLDIHNEATGVYFVKVIANNHQLIIKVIKQ